MSRPINIKIFKLDDVLVLVKIKNIASSFFQKTSASNDKGDNIVSRTLRYSSACEVKLS